jgi:DNA-directed RNA polymerase subunit M/transcription elongation factor TFIIS
MIRFRCQECGKKLKADDNIVGRKVQCTRCSNIEKVPPEDNLAKPLAKETEAKQEKAKEPSEASKRLDTNKPKPIKKKSASFKMGPPDLIAGDEPVEMFGHSGAGPTIDTEKFEPKFNSAKPKKSNMRRNVVLGLIGLGVVGTIVVVANLGWILNARRMLSTDYESLEEVKFYRNAVSKVERARLKMKIAGEAYLRIKSGSDEEKKAFADFNASVESKTIKSDMLEKVESLFRAGEDMKAKALLVNTGGELAELQVEVEKRATKYTEMTY